MAISLKHLFQSAKTDGPDNTIVQPSDWNDEHVLTQATNRLLGRTTAGTGATEEIAPGTGITLSAGTLSADVTSVAGRTGAVTLSTADISGLTTGYVQKTSATGSAYLPAGTTGQREGSPSAGYIRYNTTTGKFEGYGSAWGNIGGGAAIGDTPPANPGAGDLWWNSADGRMYVYYTDANSSQWVDLSAGGAGQYLPLTGGTVSGNFEYTGTLLGGTGVINIGSGQFYKDASGNVGLGTTASVFNTTNRRTIHVNGTTEALLALSTGNAVATSGYLWWTGSEFQLAAGGSSASVTFAANGAERMRVGANGNVGIGTNNPFYKLDVSGKIRASGQLSGGYDTAAIEVTGAATGNVGIALHCPGASAPILRNERGAGDQIDCVNSGQSAFAPFRASAFTVSSDYRVKENIVPITDGIDRVKQLKPSRFNFIEGSMMYADGRTVDGFIAHEVTPVVPEAVTGEKDAMMETGAPLLQGLDQAKLVPLLTAALQEAISRIENLEQELAQLKGGE